jgi:hypothetical protein
VTRRLALLLVVLVTAAALTAVVLLVRSGSDAGSDAPRDRAACAEAAEQTPRITAASDAFNYGDAVGCIGSDRRAEANSRREPPK